MKELERTLKLDTAIACPSGARLAVIIILQGESVGLAIQMESDRTVIGRGAQADIVLKDAIASRQHAEIVRSAGQDAPAEYYFNDLSSTNGSFVNGSKVVSQQLLQNGDKIKIGNHLLEFSLLEESEAEALLKSRGPGAKDNHSKPESVEHILCFPPFHIPADIDLLYRDETVVPLEPRAVRVLRYLAEHHERVVSKEELLESVWTDVFTTDGVLKKAVSQARHALCDSAKQARFIATYHRRGYRFIAPVHRRTRYYT